MPLLVVRPESESSFEWDTLPIMIHRADFNNRPYPRNPEQQPKREDGYQKLSHTSSNIASIKIVAVPTVIGPDTTVVTQQEDASAPVAEKKSEARSATRPTTKKSTTQTAKQPVTQAAKQSGSQATKQTIYVETYGAQGKVWGHVTLNGDRGSGTIHDVDENTLSVTVTRHGNELFAVDQNSRQYVFKIKN